MLTLENDRLEFRFPEVHRNARTDIELQITLRIPDDTKEYPLPPGLGRFPLRHVEDFKHRVPSEWAERGGVMLPMFETEAMWLSFGCHRNRYPCAIKIACGKINAVSGKPWKPELDAGEDDYIVTPTQPWLDGFATGIGQIRQFVAMPLGGGYTAEEQLTGKAEWGGLQIIVYPMKAERWEAIERARVERERRADAERAARAAAMLKAAKAAGAVLKRDYGHGNVKSVHVFKKGRANKARSSSMPVCRAAADDTFFEEAAVARARSCVAFADRAEVEPAAPVAAVAMGLGAGGRMHQEIYRDPYGIDAWDQSVSRRCFLTLVEARDWVRITGEEMRRQPPSAADYARHGLPWFDYEAEGHEALPGATELAMLKTVGEVAEGKGLDPLPGNESFDVAQLVKLGSKAGVPS